MLNKNIISSSIDFKLMIIFFFKKKEMLTKSILKKKTNFTPSLSKDQWASSNYTVLH
jgi:hypothetical protein